MPDTAGTFIPCALRGLGTPPRRRRRGARPRAVSLEVTRTEACSARQIRAAVGEDAPDMGRVMVTSFLWAHRGQMPDAAWQQRVDEWTPEVSARGWARAITERAERKAPLDVLLVAEDDSGALSALVS